MRKGSKIDPWKSISNRFYGKYRKSIRIRLPGPQNFEKRFYCIFRLNFFEKLFRIFSLCSNSRLLYTLFTLHYIIFKIIIFGQKFFSRKFFKENSANDAIHSSFIVHYILNAYNKLCARNIPIDLLMRGRLQRKDFLENGEVKTRFISELTTIISTKNMQFKHPPLRRKSCNRPFPWTQKSRFI